MIGSPCNQFRCILHFTQLQNKWIFFSWFLLLPTTTFSFYSFSLLLSHSVSLLLFLRSDRARSQLHDTSPRVRKCFVDFTIWFDILFMKEIVRAFHWIVLFHINHFTLFYITLNSLWLILQYSIQWQALTISFIKRISKKIKLKSQQNIFLLLVTCHEVEI